MNYGVILASGFGTRIKSLSIPKQYYEIDGKPIIIYTLENMLKDDLFDYVYVAINEDYNDLVLNYINKFIDKKYLDKINIVFGGKERIDTIHNVIDAISKKEIDDDDVIVVHDAVRPFVTKKILEDSIRYSREYGATVAVLPAIDTMLMSEDGKKVNSIPNRNFLYRGQAPDSFNLKKFMELENNLTEEQKNQITGTSQLCTMNNFPIYMIEGDDMNFKITTDYDLRMAENLVKELKI